MKRVVYSASSSCYGDTTKMPQNENDLIRPLSPYGLQKYIGDIISKNLTISQFKNTCEIIFENYQSVGLLYALTFALEENKIATNKILEITNDWIFNNPMDEELIKLKKYLVETNQFQ